jgi:uncharacterized protein YidB (DUF937 family)
MGLLDSLESFASTQMEQSGNPTAKVAGGLMQALEQHPGGLQGVVDQFHQNGLGGAVSGQPVDSSQIGQVLGGSGLIDSVAAKAGVSPQVAQEAMAVVLPMVMAHFTQNGGAAADAGGGLAGMASSILGKFL